VVLGHTHCGAIEATLEALARHAVRANVRVAANAMRHGSEMLERLIRQDGLLVVGAKYSLETGAVEFFDGLPLRDG